jgi:hypothetical protein
MLSMTITLEVIKTIFAMYGFLLILHNSKKQYSLSSQQNLEESMDMSESMCSNCSSILSQSKIDSETKSTQTDMVKSLDPNSTVNDININSNLIYYDGPYITAKAYQAVGILLATKK